MMGVSFYLAWAKLICFTWHDRLVVEISCFCYLCYIMKLTRISTFIALMWPQVVDTPRNSRNLSAYFLLKKALLLSRKSAPSGLELHFYPSILTRVNCIWQKLEPQKLFLSLVAEECFVAKSVRRSRPTSVSKTYHALSQNRNVNCVGEVAAAQVNSCSLI